MANATSFLNENRSYYIPVLLYFITSFILLLAIDKGEEILFFSNHRTDFWNLFFTYATKLGEEYTYILGFFGLLLFKYRYAIFAPIVAGLTAIFSFSLKSLFAHPRPKVWFEGLGETLNYVPDVYVHVGNGSFPSGHAMSGFAIFGFLALVSSKWWLKTLFALCAILTALSRVYLVQHFLEDIFFGAFLGTFVAISVYWLQKRLLNDEADKWWNRALVKI
jgi:membrane-associated phospholipid phosphatase